MRGGGCITAALIYSHHVRKRTLFYVSCYSFGLNPFSKWIFSENTFRVWKCNILREKLLWRQIVVEMSKMLYLVCDWLASHANQISGQNWQAKARQTVKNSNCSGLGLIERKLWYVGLYFVFREVRYISGKVDRDHDFLVMGIAHLAKPLSASLISDLHIT